MKWLQHVFSKDIETYNFEHEDTAMDIYRKIEHIH